MKRDMKDGIQLPQIPKPLEPAGEMALEDGELYAGLHLASRDFAGAQWGGLVFEQSLLQRVSFLEARVASLRLGDCRLERCDLSAAGWLGARLRRVEFSGCRLLGVNLAESALEDARFSDCLAERANFTWAVFKRARFEKCDLREAAFLGADLRGVVFRDCDLSGADLREAQLAGADLRGARLDGLKVGLKELQGVILTSMQGIQALGLLGVKIKELDEEVEE